MGDQRSSILFGRTQAQSGWPPAKRDSEREERAKRPLQGFKKAIEPDMSRQLLQAARDSQRPSPLAASCCFLAAFLLLLDFVVARATKTNDCEIRFKWMT